MGDALLPVERPMTEDKAGWGLVPGLQEPLLHIHTAAAAPWAAPTTAGLGWAGRAAPELACTQRLGGRRKATRLGPASGAKVKETLFVLLLAKRKMTLACGCKGRFRGGRKTHCSGDGGKWSGWVVLAGILRRTKFVTP